MQHPIDYADFLQRFSTKALWHFTGYNKSDNESLDILVKIIKDKVLKISEHPGEIIMPDGKKRFSFSYSCVCDIPFKDLRIHTERYGKYGIAFEKNKAIISGHFNPILYIHKDNFLFKEAYRLLKDIDNFVTPHNELSEKLNKYLNIMGIAIKRGNLTAPIDMKDKELDKQQDNNFYYEREWRSAFEWSFQEQDIEAVMVPKKDLIAIKESLVGFGSLVVIPYEMVEKL